MFPGYDGYVVSKNGDVGSLRPRNRNAEIPEEPRILTPNTSSTGGYEWVTLYGQGSPRKVRVHDLVAFQFLGTRPEGLQILHLDDNPLNNHVDNLRYGTPRENAIDKSINSGSDNVLKFLDEFGHYCNAVSTSKGFWDLEPNPDVYLAKMALIHSEVSEVLEAYRKQQGPEKIADEFADIFIRMVDLWSVMNQQGEVGSLRDAILAKTMVNRDRPKMHGNLI
jgi:NTP pyrophosphatase (non-canonical NTP hydrolase)